MDIYSKIGEIIAEGKGGALCSIIETSGSTPRKAGSKLIGSRKKIEEARFFFTSQGMDAGQLESIDMPIGIPMNCETPAEIAISILARLIDVKNS